MAKEDGGETEQQQHVKDYQDPPPAAFIDVHEFGLWSFYRALIAEFIATLLFLYITIATVIGHSRTQAGCGSVGILGIAWAFGGMIFVLVYCTAGISGGHINPAVTFGLFLARKVSLPRAVMYMIAQCLGAICGAGLVKAFQKSYYDRYGGGANFVAPGYTKGVGLAAEIIGTFVLVYTVFSATDPKRNARDSHVPVLELGIVAHSVIIGISLGASESPCTIRPLIAALTFHQFFEGIGLGGCIVQARFKNRSTALMAFFFSITTPLGIAVGIAISSTYNENSSTALIVEGMFDAASAGILIYMALVDLLAADFLGSRMQSKVGLQLWSYTSLLLGIGAMSLLAKWA